MTASPSARARCSEVSRISSIASSSDHGSGHITTAVDTTPPPRRSSTTNATRLLSKGNRQSRQPFPVESRSITAEMNDPAARQSAGFAPAPRRLHIHAGRQRVALDELPAGFDLVAHQLVEDGVGFVDFLDADL